MFLSILLAAALMAGALNPSSPQVPETVYIVDQGKSGEKQPEKVKNEITGTNPVVTRHKVVVKGK